MNEATLILFELRALAEQIDHLECQARINSGEAQRQPLSGQAAAQRDMTTRARPQLVRQSRGEDSFNRAQPNRAAMIVARLGVRRDRLFDALHARNTARA